jgi:signal transduction histidine kinase
MVTQSNFRLINDLFDNIALLDHNLKPIFQGSLLRKLLLENHINLSRLDLAVHKENILFNKFNEAVSFVEASGLPYTLKFPDIKEQFLLFSISDKYYCFGKWENLIHFIRIEHDLGERVKELECLYNISSEYDSMQQLDTFFEKCTRIIEEGFQYPADTIANIILNEKIYGRSNWSQKDITDLISAEVLVNKKKIGEIKVYITKGLDIIDEERKLIDEVSHKFSKILEKREEEKNLEKQKKILTVKNEALSKITEECSQKREQLKTFIHAITDKIIVVDRDFNILMSNKEEIGEGGKCHVKLFNSDQRCVECPALKTFEDSVDSAAEKKFKERHFTLSAHPIFAENGSPRQVDRVLEVCRDITDRKRMESQMFQSYKLASLGKLVAGVAHEINNPNTFILGNLKIVQEAFEDIFPLLDQQYESNNELKIARLNYQLFKENINILVKDMVNGANRTKKIVEDLRNFAKKDEEEINEDIDLNYIIKNNLTLTQKHIKKYAQLEIKLNENIPLFKGNINKIEQVLLNLTMNASEAIENKNGIIKIITDYNEIAEEILLCISDNGSGIDEAVIKNIFDPFFTTKRNKGGIGLGLSITYGIVKDHQGKIEVESKKGYGTTFTIRFPVKQRN